MSVLKSDGASRGLCLPCLLSPNAAQPQTSQRPPGDALNNCSTLVSKLPRPVLLYLILYKHLSSRLTLLTLLRTITDIRPSIHIRPLSLFCCPRRPFYNHQTNIVAEANSHPPEQNNISCDREPWAAISQLSPVSYSQRKR